MATTEGFCLLMQIPIEVLSEILRFVCPRSPKELHLLASVNKFFRQATKDAAINFSINLGDVTEKDDAKIGNILRVLTTTFPRLSLVTFNAALPNIENYSNDSAWHTNYVSPPLYGRLVLASLSGSWNDQGWGNQKGHLQFEVCEEDSVGVRVMAAPGVAPHHLEEFETIVRKDEWPNDLFVGGEGFYLNQLFHVGGGGGHSLHVRWLKLTIGLSPNEWNLWMTETSKEKLTHEEGWVWCIDGKHPSLLLRLHDNGGATFSSIPSSLNKQEREKENEKESENESERQKMGKRNREGLVSGEDMLKRLCDSKLKWEFHPLYRQMVLRSTDTEQGGFDCLLSFDKEFQEFYVYHQGRGSRGFSLHNRPPIIKPFYVSTLIPSLSRDLPQANRLLSSTKNGVGRQLILSGVRVLDPSEELRRYSSVWEKCPPGQGHVQSAIDSPLAWCAGQNKSGEWVEMPVAPKGEKATILGVAVQRRSDWFVQCVRKIQVSCKKSDRVLKTSEFSVGFGHQFFEEPVRARYFRICPTQWNEHISMRAGLLLSQERKKEKESEKESESENIFAVLNPSEDKRSYSSIWDNDPIGSGHARSMLNSDQAWSAGRNDTNQWMQIDAGEDVDAAGVFVQPRQGSCQAVTAWRIQTKRDGERDWTTVHVDGSSEFKEDMQEPIFLWFDEAVEGVDNVRIAVLEWDCHISLRCGVIVAEEGTKATKSSKAPPSVKKKRTKAKGK